MNRQVPSGLDDAGRAAWCRAFDSVVALSQSPDLFADSMLRYALAVDDAARIRAEWVAKERPVVTWVNNDQMEARHPLFRAVQEADAAAAKYGAALGLDPAALRRVAPLSNGRPNGAVSSPDRKTPAAPVLTPGKLALKAVK